MPVGDVLLHFLLLNVCVLNSINLVSVSVPESVPTGSPAILTCSFVVSPGQFMDSVKWYLNSSEIYRIVPSLTKDRVLTFPLDCLTVSLPQSGLVKPGSHRLVLENVTAMCQGRYTCQVTGGSPPFHTGVAGGHLSILVLPTAGPTLHGLLGHYQVGQMLNVSCRSGSSAPPASIHWTWNGEQIWANSSSLSWTDSGLATTFSSLVLKLSSPSLPNSLTIICTSIIGKEYQKQTEWTAILDKPTSPVLGEPLMSSKSRRGWQDLPAVCLFLISYHVCCKTSLGLEYL